MSRVLKSDQTVAGSLKVKVYQQTTESLPEEDPSGPEEPSGREDAERGYALISEAKRKILERARNQAEQSAAALLEDAYSQRDKIVNTAARQAESIKEEARREGYRAGIAEAGADISRQLAEILSSVETMGECLEQQSRELCGKIAGFYLEIADLVEQAVLSERDKRSIVVHLSGRSRQLVEDLERKLESLRDSSDGSLRIKTEEKPPGYVQIETEEGIVDASVFVQLENLKEQLEALDRQT